MRPGMEVRGSGKGHAAGVRIDGMALTKIALTLASGSEIVEM